MPQCKAGSCLKFVLANQTLAGLRIPGSPPAAKGMTLTQSRAPGDVYKRSRVWPDRDRRAFLRNRWGP